MDCSPRNKRLLSLDAMRGLIMVLMAMDHVSFFVAKAHSHEFWGTAMPWYDSAMPFLLRAVTHLCAPGFFLLMGVGMAFFTAGRIGEGWGNWRVTRFFLIRGFLLIAFQQFLENPAWYLGSLGTAAGAFTFRGGPIPGGGASAKFYLGVLYGLGSTMVVWGLLFRLPTFAVMALSMAAMILTQVVVSEFADSKAVYPFLLRMLLIPGIPTNGWYSIRRYRGWELPDWEWFWAACFKVTILVLSAAYGYPALVPSCFLSSFVCSTGSAISTGQRRDGSVFST